MTKHKKLIKAIIDENFIDIKFWSNDLSLIVLNYLPIYDNFPKTIIKSRLKGDEIKQVIQMSKYRLAFCTDNYIHTWDLIENKKIDTWKITNRTHIGWSSHTLLCKIDDDNLAYWIYPVLWVCTLTSGGRFENFKSRSFNGYNFDSLICMKNNLLFARRTGGEIFVLDLNEEEIECKYTIYDKITYDKYCNDRQFSFFDYIDKIKNTSNENYAREKINDENDYAEYFVNDRDYVCRLTRKVIIQYPITEMDQILRKKFISINCDQVAIIDNICNSENNTVTSNIIIYDIKQMACVKTFDVGSRILSMTCVEGRYLAVTIKNKIKVYDLIHPDNICVWSVNCESDYLKTIICIDTESIATIVNKYNIYIYE